MATPYYNGDKIRKITVKGVKLKSESFFLISPGVLELWRKNLRGVESTPPPPGMDRVKAAKDHGKNYKQLRPLVVLRL